MPKTLTQTYHNPSGATLEYSYPTTVNGSPITGKIKAGAEFEGPTNYEKFFKRCGFRVGPAKAGKSAPPPPASDDSESASSRRPKK